MCINCIVYIQQGLGQHPVLKHIHMSAAKGTLCKIMDINFFSLVQANFCYQMIYGIADKGPLTNSSIFGRRSRTWWHFIVITMNADRLCIVFILLPSYLYVLFCILEK